MFRLNSEKVVLTQFSKVFFSLLVTLNENNEDDNMNFTVQIKIKLFSIFDFKRIHTLSTQISPKLVNSFIYGVFLWDGKPTFYQRRALSRLRRCYFLS